MRMCENPCQYGFRFSGVFTHHCPEVAGHANFDSLTLKAWTVLMDGPGPGCRDIVPATFSSTGCCNMCVLSPMVQYGVAKSLRKSPHGAWEVTPWWLAVPRLPGERPVVAYNHIPRHWIWAKIPEHIFVQAYSQHNWSPIFRYGCRSEIWASKNPPKTDPLGLKFDNWLEVLGIHMFYV